MAKSFVTGLWGSAAIAVLLWPGNLAGPLDGAPLDRVSEAILLGLVPPFLWWLRPEYLRSRIARVLIVTLVLAKAGSMLLARDGWCVQFDTPKPLVTDSQGRIHAWDVRADWLSETPKCSAIMTRPYREFKEFPVWFFNMPPTDGNLPGPGDRPPSATLEMTASGYFDRALPWELIVETGETMKTTLVVDGSEIAPVGPSRHQVTLGSGRHFVQVKSQLTGNRWTFVPLSSAQPIWNGFAMPTTTNPSSSSEALRLPLAIAISIGAFALVIGWVLSFLWKWGDRVTLSFSLVASVVLAWLGTPPPDYVMTPLASWSITALGLAILLHVPKPQQTLKGAFVLIGIPWLAFVTAVHASHIGRFSFYAGGDDMWMFQRFAYRIYLQGYWLQGGELTFWFQPFYRWIAGAWHLVFGDSSMGEFWWDAVCLMASALFAHHVVAATYGFRWGLAAAVLCLTIVMQGPAWMFVGLGLSDIASAGFIYFAALVIMSSRLRGPVPLGAAVAAGVLASIGFYTRLNNLPMAFASAAFGLSLAVTSRGWWRPPTWWPQVSWNALYGVAGVIVIAMTLFTLRTYHYTGVFSMLHGTTWGNHALWRPGQPVSDAAAGMLSSLLMVLTFNDPPRFAPYAVPLLFGAIVAIGALAGVKRLRDIPLALTAFFVVACSGALAARGVAYAGRFSVHLLGAGCALTVAAIASLVATRNATPLDRGSSRSSDPARG